MGTSPRTFSECFINVSSQAKYHSRNVHCSKCILTMVFTFSSEMLKSKIVHLKEIYNFDFDHFLIKRTVFVLIVKNVIKNQKFNFPNKLRHIKKMLKNKIVRFKKIYKFYFDHLLIKCTIFVLIMKNVIKNQKYNSLVKLNSRKLKFFGEL